MAFLEIFYFTRTHACPKFNHFSKNKNTLVADMLMMRAGHKTAHKILGVQAAVKTYALRQ